MRSPLAALALLAVLAAPSSAAHPCISLPGIGCWYAPAGLTGDPPLLVYLRGHHPSYGPNVPPVNGLASARQAFDDYGLENAARSSGHVVLVTYKSAVSVGEADVAKLAAQTGFHFPRRVIAAHSGAYVGLGETLRGGLAAQRVILLDCFYVSSRDLADAVQRQFGGSCVGFFTPHQIPRSDGRPPYDNETNFRKNFERYAPGCRIENLGAGQHNPGVNRCLPAYLAGRPCPGGGGGAGASAGKAGLPDESVIEADGGGPPADGGSSPPLNPP